MGYWDKPGASNDWYTPKYIFKALNCHFDLDVAHPAVEMPITPAESFISAGSLNVPWFGFVWMNPPFGGRNGIVPWLDKFFTHGNGIALTPDRTSASWWQDAAAKADAVLFISGKVKFRRPDGSLGKSPSNGTTLFASGPQALDALINASDADLGFLAIDREQGIRDLMETLAARDEAEAA